ncbi:PAS domain S-box protein [Candidatus Pacearchaeota archaeon]|nr:PAS domain S-box protein [Candidatus Pacearchaeota archaeon]
MNKIPENQKDRSLQKIEHLEIEISILRDAYFQLEKAILKRKQVEEKYRLLVETSLDMIQSVNPSGKLDFVNDAWLKTLGYTREEVKNMNLFNIIHKDSLEHCKSLFSKVIAGESIKNIEAIFVAKDGRQVNVEGNATPIIIDGKVTATHGFFKDVTERKKAEHNLKERMKELKLIYEISRIMERRG